ncbi:MAG: shikimate kinase [bacterium]
MNIILFGFKNCGKTTLGKLLATKLNLDFIDTDDLLAKRYQEKYKESLSTQQIYKILGEIKFRDLEKEVINPLAHVENTVIATGGGSVMDKESTKILKNIGKMVYLKAPKQLMKERIFAGKLPAFLDAKDKAASFEKIYANRETVYDTIAEIVVEIIAKTNEEIIQEIKSKVDKHGN